MYSKHRNNVDMDMKHANKLGEALVPIVNNKIAGEVIQTEHLDEFVAQLLDKKSKIDGLYKFNTELAGVALRIQQHSNKNWGTFTIRHIRANTNNNIYERLKEAVFNQHPSFYPHYTCQAYFDSSNNLLGGAMCLTKSILDVTIKHEPINKNRSRPVYLNENTADGNTFIVIPFDLVNPIIKF